MIIAQLSDPHVSSPGTEFYDCYHTPEKLKIAIEKVQSLSPVPDAIVMTGDLVNCGGEDEYEVLKEVLKSATIPVYLGIGNHDCRETIRKVIDADYFPKDGFLQYEWMMGDVRCLMLDTNIPGEPCGILCEERLSWLDDRLSEQTETPTIVFMHHPPFLTGIKAMDDMGLKDADKFGEVVAKHDQIIRICCGHLHRTINADFHGRHAQVCASTSHKVFLHLEDTPRLATTNEPSDFLLHFWTSEQKLVTHMGFTDPSDIIWELEKE